MPVFEFGPHELGQYTLVGWWRRVGAQLIDGVVIVVLGAGLVLELTGRWSIGFFARDAHAFGLLLGPLTAGLAVLVSAHERPAKDRRRRMDQSVYRPDDPGERGSRGHERPDPR